MKYRTFRIIRFIVIIIVIIILIILLSRLVCSNNNIPVSQYNTASVATSGQSSTIYRRPASNEKVISVSQIDKEIIEYQKSATSTGELDKDEVSYIRRIKTNNYLLELRCDHKKGFSFWNRAKIDFNKDKNWDEKWTFSKEGKVKRQISTKDDENYDLIYNLKGEHWMIK